MTLLEPILTIQYSSIRWGYHDLSDAFGAPPHKEHEIMIISSQRSKIIIIIII